MLNKNKWINTPKGCIEDDMSTYCLLSAVYIRFQRALTLI